jgi:hypothetical protein
VSVWPFGGHQFGIDITYEGATGADLAAQHEANLRRVGVRYSFR